MLRAKQAQILICFAIQIHETVQHGGMAANREIAVVVGICGNVEALRPELVGLAEAPVRLEFVQRIGEDPCRALVAVLLQYRLQAVRREVHSVKVLPDGILNGLPARHIGSVAFTPECDLVPPPGILGPPWIEVGIIHDSTPRASGGGGRPPAGRRNRSAWSTDLHPVRPGAGPRRAFPWAGQ